MNRDLQIQNNEENNMAMTREEWADAMVRWLEGFPWIWFCSLTYRPGPSEAQARCRLRRWLGDLREGLGTPDFGFFAVREYGKTGADLHYHLLVMGLAEKDAGARVAWMHRWWKLAGDGLITPYAPKAGGLYYILKNAGPNDADAIEFDLSPDTQLQTTLEKK
jgi:hypothetical protein